MCDKHYFARRVDGYWRCLCGETRDRYGNTVVLDVIQ